MPKYILRTSCGELIALARRVYVSPYATVHIHCFRGKATAPNQTNRGRPVDLDVPEAINVYCGIIKIYAPERTR